MEHILNVTENEFNLILAALLTLEKGAKTRGDAITALNCAKLYEKVRGA